jgi:hypothetical protein
VSFFRTSVCCTLTGSRGTSRTRVDAGCSRTTGAAAGGGRKCEAKVAIEEAPAIATANRPTITNGATLRFPAAAAGGAQGGAPWGTGAGAGGCSSRISTSPQYWQRASAAPAANSTGAPQLSQRGTLTRPISKAHRDRKTAAGEAPAMATFGAAVKVPCWGAFGVGVSQSIWTCRSSSAAISGSTLLMAIPVASSKPASNSSRGSTSMCQTKSGSSAWRRGALKKVRL